MDVDESQFIKASKKEYSESMVNTALAALFLGIILH